MNKYQHIFQKFGRGRLVRFAVEWPWEHGSKHLHCVYVSGICMLNLNLLAFIAPDISTFIRTDRQTDGRGQIDLAMDPDQE